MNYWKILIAAIQPVLWWFIYTLLRPWAVAHDSDEGLIAACIICPLIFIVFLISSIVTEWEKKNKKS